MKGRVKGIEGIWKIKEWKRKRKGKGRGRGDGRGGEGEREGEEGEVVRERGKHLRTF